MKRTISFKLFRFIVLFFLFTQLLSGKDDLKNNKISLQLHWKFQFQFAGFIIAKEKGFYKDAGFDVELREYTSNIESIADEIIDNRATFGTSNSFLLIERQKQNVVLLANYLKQSPHVIATNKTINHPKDLEGKRLMLPLSNIKNSSIDFLFKHIGVDTKTFILRNQSFDIQQLIDDEIDAMGIYTSNELYRLKEENYPYNIIDPKDYGFSFGTTNLFTSEANVKKYGKDKIKDFIEASNLGWEYALNNIDETVDIIYNKYNHSLQKTKPSLAFEANKIKELFLLNQFPIGAIDKDTLYRLENIISNFGLIENSGRFEDFIFDDQWHDFQLSKTELIIYTMFIIMIVGFVGSVVFIRFSQKKIKDNNKMLQTLMDSAMESMVLSDSQFNIISVNNSVPEELGYDRNDYIGKNLLYFLPEEELKKAKDALLKESVDKYEIKIKKADGSLADVLMSGRYIEINNKRFRLSTFIDISDLKRKDNMLKNSAKLADMGEMIANIAHQWKQPLNALGTNIQLIEYDFDDQLIDKQYIKEFTEENFELIQFMSQTIDSFRDYFKVDKKQHPFSVQEAIERVLKILESNIKRHNVTIELDIDDFQYTAVFGEFQQVVLNIIKNAIDVAEEREIKNPIIKVTVKDFTITIEDNCKGIKKEDLDKVFDPYFTTKHQSLGTGIGLYMSKMIINSFSGDIEVQNGSKGAIFTIKLQKDEL